MGELLKIGQIAQQSGVSISTVKYYISLGLIGNAVKTSANMAYYDSSVVGRILLIKKLQKERFYPLSVIKQLSVLSGDTEAEIDLIDAIYKHDRGASAPRETTFSRIPEETGLTAEQVTKLIKSGIVGVPEEKSMVFPEEDVKILNLVSSRLKAGMSFEHTLECFKAYHANLKEAVNKDIASMITSSFFGKKLSNSQLVHLIKESDKSLEEFVRIERAKLNREVAIKHLSDMSAFAERFSTYIKGILEVVYSSKKVNEFLELEHHSDLKKCVSEFQTMKDKCNISISLDAFWSALSVFGSMKPENYETGIYRGIAGAMRLGFYALCPEVIYDAAILRDSLEIGNFDKRILTYLGIENKE